MQLESNKRPHLRSANVTVHGIRSMPGPQLLTRIPTFSLIFYFLCFVPLCLSSPPPPVIPLSFLPFYFTRLIPLRKSYKANSSFSRLSSSFTRTVFHPSFSFNCWGSNNISSTFTLPSVFNWNFTGFITHVESLQWWCQNLSHQFRWYFLSKLYPKTYIITCT